jgi:hypothetical protein
MRKFFKSIVAWFLVKYFLTHETEDLDFEMHVCEMCGTIYMDVDSYLTHFMLNQCHVEMYTMPPEQLEIRTRK